MGKIPDQPFLQRGHTDGQKACEKLFTITSYQRNANQNYHKLSLHTGKKDHYQNLQTLNAGEDGKKRELSYTVDGNINWYSHYEVQYGGFLKI